ncbi:MAG: extradiol ring-cleavage dioxygenase [Pararhodobacter sp.]
MFTPTPGPIPDTPLFDRERSHLGYELNKMSMSLVSEANRQAFAADEEAYLDRYKLTQAQRAAVLARDWQGMVREGGNIFYILKISALKPMAVTAIGAAQVGMSHEDFLVERLGKERKDG